MKVFVTKYALTIGIEEIDVEVCKSVGPSMVKEISLRLPRYFHGEGKEWHCTLSAAIERAEIMRNAKLKNMRKTIKKIENLDFSKVRT